MALRHLRGSCEGRGGALETGRAATDQRAVGVVRFVLFVLAAGAGGGLPFVWPVSAFGESVELLVVMAAEMRVTVEEL